MSGQFDRGLEIRRAVLGESYVTKSFESAGEFGRELQELVTEYCWGAVWGRDGLDFKTRSLLNVAMLTALDRQHELATHVRASLTNGVTPDEIREVIIQAAAYCGVPAALEASRTAQQVLEAEGAIPPAEGTGR